MLGMMFLSKSLSHIYISVSYGLKTEFTINFEVGRCLMKGNCVGYNVLQCIYVPVNPYCNLCSNYSK